MTQKNKRKKGVEEKVEPSRQLFEGGLISVVLGQTSLVISIDRSNRNSQERKANKEEGTPGKERKK